MVDRVAAAAGVLNSHNVSTQSNTSQRHTVGGNLNIRDDISTAGNSLVARLASPDAYCLALDAILAAECAGVAGMLGNFHLLDLLT